MNEEIKQEQQQVEPQSEEKQPYTPRPLYQLVIAWALLAIVVVGVILWLLEIGTAGKLFGLLG
jgi:hypothetical protein